MCLNELLRDEQIALMRHAATTNPAEISVHRRTLSLFSKALTAYPYPHRPYDPATGAPVAAGGAHQSGGGAPVVIPSALDERAD